MNFLILAALFLTLGPQKTDLGVEFTIYAPYAEKVYLAGDFNQWKPDQLLMKKDSLGVWHFTLYLPPGRYEYKFVVDGQWVSDPFNPVQAGPFGNSVIWVDKNGNVSFSEKFKANVPGNSSVTVHGDLRGFVEVRKDTLTRNFYDAKLIFDALVGGSRIWSRLHYSTEGVGAGNVPVALDRLETSLRRGVLGFSGFYNQFMINFDDPLTIVGRVGEMQDPYGLGEEGVILTTSAFLKDNLTLLYGRNLTNARDLLAGRYKWILKKLVAGVNFRKRDWHGGTRDELYSVDLAVYPRSGSRLWTELGVGSSFEEFQFRYRKVLAGVGVLTKSGNRELWLRLENEQNRYFDMSKFSFRRFEIGGRWGVVRAGLVHTVARAETEDVDSEIIWERLFDYTWADRLTIPEYPLVAYKNKTVRFVEVGFGRRLPKVSLRYAEYAPGLNYKPIVREGIIRVGLDFGRFGAETDMRLVRYDSDFLGLDDGFVAPYVELRYAFNAFVALKISWGLMPYDLDDLYRNREAFLHEEGLSASAAQFSYSRLGRTIKYAESQLQGYRPITIWTVIKF